MNKAAVFGTSEGCRQTSDSVDIRFSLMSTEPKQYRFLTLIDQQTWWFPKNSDS